MMIDADAATRKKHLSDKGKNNLEKTARAGLGMAADEKTNQCVPCGRIIARSSKT